MALATFAGSGLAALALTGTASAATPCGANGVFSSDGQTATCTYTAPGQDTFTVPAGVSSITLTTTGAAGGDNPCGQSSGGEGASVSATTPVSGPQLSVGVGGPGGNLADNNGVCSGVAAGGVGGGGSGGDVPRRLGFGGGGGGGASWVGVGSSSPSVGALLVVAAGGGGGTLGGNGGAADSPGMPSSNCGPSWQVACGGGAGTSTAGGAGGASGGEPVDQDGSPGSPGLGGDGGGGYYDGGGGGGGGYYGGGGGGSGGIAGGGGGGSSFTAPNATNVAGPTVTSDPPEVSISYTVPQATTTTTTLTGSPNPALATQPVTLTAQVAPAPDGGTVAFKNGASTIANCTAQPLNTSTGIATCQTTSLPTGSDRLTAVYSGDTNYQTSTSSPALSEVVLADTPAALAHLTLQYVQQSARFTALPPRMQKLIVAFADRAIAQLAKISPNLTPAQLARLKAAYTQALAMLRAQGYLSAAQQSTLDTLANNLTV